MRLIDADALFPGKLLVVNLKNPMETAKDLLNRINTAPTIDAVPVVRCKDCKHMAVVGVGFRWCKAWERMQTMGDDGFCSRGERRSDD